MITFKNVVNDDATLRSILGKPHAVVANKSLSSLDKHCRQFIARSPFLLLATSDNDGNFDLSPKGDPAGFVSILDDQTLVIPDRPGNRRADSFFNILKNPNVGLLFMIPGKKESLRVAGKAQIIRDKDILSTMAIRNKAPELGLAIEVKEAFFHCAKCMVRSNLWSPSDWPDISDLPSLAETMVGDGKSKIPKVILDVAVKVDQRKRLF